MSAAEGRHRPEITRRVIRDVDLWRHRPFAAIMRDERGANCLDRRSGRHGELDLARAEYRNASAHGALTPATSLSTDSFASPKSIPVFGSTKSGLSIPANPVAIERLLTTICFA